MVWGAATTLTRYVGTGPTCGFPPNVVKEAPVIVGQLTQAINLIVDPYDAVWAMYEFKEFGSASRSGFPAPWSSGTIVRQVGRRQRAQAIGAHALRNMPTTWLAALSPHS